ncbi:hypothetical protein OIV83_006164 [Microbotryomycetes sp. JL201]|nr:hypothetical protein OIV83_006164 [Microbotryomycetes sp. JL201]
MAPPKNDQLSFTAARDKLNPKFESYKLHPAPADALACRHRLARPLALTSALDHVPLSFAEAQSRAEHNHLSAGLGGYLTYIDRDLRFVAVEVLNASDVKMHELVQLPPCEPSSSAFAAEYPVAVSLTPSRWCLCDGFSSLYVVEVATDDQGWRAIIVSRHSVATKSVPAAAGYRLCWAAVDAISGEVIAVVSTPRKRTGSRSLPECEEQTGGALQSSTFFAVSCLRLASTNLTAQTIAEAQEVWTLFSASVPFATTFEPNKNRLLFCGTHPLTLKHVGVPPALSQNGSDDRQDSDPPTSSSFVKVDKPGHQSDNPPSFSWTQDNESVSLAFPIPSDTPTSSIRVVFSRQHLSVHIATPTQHLQTDRASRRAWVSHKQLWDEIDQHTSVWTFDREAEGRGSAYGLLVLHLEKKNPGTRWTGVFQPTLPITHADSAEKTEGEHKIRELTAAEEQAELEAVPETLDPSDLAAIVERMEQWTQSTSIGRSDAQAQPEIRSSLLGDEIDVEVDSDVGRPFVTTWVDRALDQKPQVVCPHSSVPFSAISLPLNTASIPPAGNIMSASVVTKHDVDGLLFTPPTSSTSSHVWTHGATFPALAFVLASKRDCTFVRHVGDRVVLALDTPPQVRRAQGGASHNHVVSMNAFLYYRPDERNARTATQRVVKIGGLDSGAVLGVAGVVNGPGSNTLACVLCENELVVFPLFDDGDPTAM